MLARVADGQTLHAAGHETRAQASEMSTSGHGCPPNRGGYPHGGDENPPTGAWGLGFSAWFGPAGGVPHGVPRRDAIRRAQSA
jgi:hypothetical protein